MEKEFKSAARLDCRAPNCESHLAAGLAAITMDMAYRRLLSDLNLENFDQYSVIAWGRLPECLVLANALYEQAVKVLFVMK